MPVYEYECQKCKRRFSRFFWKMADAEGTKCRCGSGRLEQLVSKVAMHQSEESRLEKFGDPSNWGDFNENDPKSVARMMRGMSSEMGEELPEELKEMVGRLEAGESPEDIEAEMGDSLDSSSGAGGEDLDNLF